MAREGPEVVPLLAEADVAVRAHQHVAAYRAQAEAPPRGAAGVEQRPFRRDRALELRADEAQRGRRGRGLQHLPRGLRETWQVLRIGPGEDEPVVLGPPGPGVHAGRG